MMEGFDVGLMREMMARQAADAGRLVMLCDVAANQEKELIALRAKVANLEPKAAPAPSSKP